MSDYIQKILFGGPGSGKSYRIEKCIIPEKIGSDKEIDSANIIKTVFHPEYTYGDFMGKIVPLTMKDGTVKYKFYAGFFLQALTQAYNNYLDIYDELGNKSEKNKEVKDVFLVIDEINRGNSSSIFGSIFQLLDRDKDGWSNYDIRVNEIEFLSILELIGIEVTGYDQTNNMSRYKLPKYKKDYSLTEGTIFNGKILDFNLKERTIKIPPNLSIIATMNTSNSSVYYMDSAFKRRWDWEFININGEPTKSRGTAFNNREEWQGFVEDLNRFIKGNHKYIRGIEDKQIGYYFLTGDKFEKNSIQNKLMFFIWDSVFSRDKKPLVKLLYGENKNKDLITFGDFSKEVDLFIEKIKAI